MNHVTPFDASALSLSVDDRLEAIAKDIEITQSNAILRVGQALSEARDLFRYKRDEGGFEGWLQSRLSFPRSTAYKIISVFEQFGAESVSRLDTLPRSVLYELAAPSTADEVRKTISERAAEGVKVSLSDVKELKAKIAERDERLRTLKTQKQSAEVENEKLIDEVRGKANECHRLNDAVAHLQEEIRRLTEPGTITVRPNEPERIDDAAAPATVVKVREDQSEDISAWQSMMDAIWSNAPSSARDWIRDFVAERS